MKGSGSDKSKEIRNLLIFIVLFFVLLKIGFYKEGLGVIFKACMAITIMDIIPGYLLSDLLFPSSGYLERMIIGIALSLAIIGIFGYYLGLIGLHIKYFIYVFYAGLLISYGAKILRSKTADK